MRWAMRIWWISSAPSAKRAQRACFSMSRERRVGRVAERAVHLDRAVDDPPQHVGHEVLGHRHLADVKSSPLLDLVRGVQHHQLALVQLHRRVGDHPLDALLLGEQRAVAEAVQRPRRPSCRAPSRPGRSSACSARAGPGRGGTGRAGAPDPGRRACWRAARAGRSMQDLAVVVAAATSSRRRARSPIRPPGGRRGTPCWPPAGSRGRPRCGRSGWRTSAPRAPEMNHLWPLMTHSSPSR